MDGWMDRSMDGSIDTWVSRATHLSHLLHGSATLGPSQPAHPAATTSVYLSIQAAEAVAVEFREQKVALKAGAKWGAKVQEGAAERKVAAAAEVAAAAAATVIEEAAAEAAADAAV